MDNHTFYLMTGSIIFFVTASRQQEEKTSFYGWHGPLTIDSLVLIENHINANFYNVDRNAHKVVERLFGSCI